MYIKVIYICINVFYNIGEKYFKMRTAANFLIFLIPLREYPRISHCKSGPFSGPG